MKTYSVSITDYAQMQLKDIAKYIKYELQSPQAASAFLTVMEKSISSLSSMPNRISLEESEPWRSLGIHKMPVKNYLIYFLVKEDCSEVHITAIIYNKREQKQQLLKMEL